MAWTRGRGQRGRTKDLSRPGARQKAVGALTAFKQAARDQTIDTVREGINNVSQKIGAWAGAGVAAAGATVAEAVGYRPTPMITVGAVGVGMWFGGLVGRILNAGLDRITAGQNASPIGNVMEELAVVLQTLDRLGEDVDKVIDSVNKAHAHVHEVGRGQGSNLLDSAVRAYQQAPVRFQEAVAELKEGQKLVAAHLVTVATAGG